MSKEKMKKCSHCGADIAAAAKVCPVCGGKNKQPFHKKVLFFVLIVVIAAGIYGLGTDDIDEESAWAESYTALSDFKYFIDGDEIYLKDYKGSESKVYINSSYDVDGTSKRVVSLDGTFALDRVSSVIIPDGVKSMSNNVFNSCGVEYVYLPASLTQFDGWSYFHDVKKIYYGGTEEQWEKLCTVERSDVDAEQIICNTNIEDLK